MRNRIEKTKEQHLQASRQAANGNAVPAWVRSLQVPATRATEQVETIIGKRPGIAVAAALLSGIAIGILVKRS